MSIPNLPLYQTDDPTLTQMQSVWKANITPAIQSPILQGHQLNDIKLVVGSNTINHKLQRMQQGWFVVDQNGSASIYRSAPLNATTLALTSNAAVTVSLWVF